MRRTLGKTKIRQHRGQGRGKDYIPSIKTREVNSIGTKGKLKDWKNGRTIHTLSQNETRAYYLIRWNDCVIDIREQYPMERTKTTEIAESIGIQHPFSSDLDECLTTDFLVDWTGEKGEVRQTAISVKENRKQVMGDLNNPKVRKVVLRQIVEAAYWRQEGIDFRIIYGDELDQTRAVNISVIVDYYNFSSVFTVQDLLLFLMARKIIEVDLSRPIFFSKIAAKLESDKDELRKWIQYLIKFQSQLDIEEKDLDRFIKQIS